MKEVVGDDVLYDRVRDIELKDGAKNDDAWQRNLEVYLCQNRVGASLNSK